MKTAYLDTNIFLTLLRPNDPHYNSVRRVSKVESLSYVTGIITVLELTSVFSREYSILKAGILELAEAYDLRELVELSKEEQIIAIIQFLFQAFRAKIIGNQRPDERILVNDHIPLDPINKLAILQSTSSEMRALDNLHFAFSRFTKHHLGYDLQYFVTLDEGFLKKGQFCQEFSNIHFVHPTSLEELEISSV